LLFEVEDHGIGISDQEMSQLFKPFKQTQRLAGGTGLGLYSLAKRMEGIQGEFGVRGRKDGEKGSLFWFMIPYRPDELFGFSLSQSCSGGSNTQETKPKAGVALPSENGMSPPTLEVPPLPLSSSILLRSQASSLDYSDSDNEEQVN
jgi:hypothetical protein